MGVCAGSYLKNDQQRRPIGKNSEGQGSSGRTNSNDAKAPPLVPSPAINDLDHRKRGGTGKAGR